MLKISRKNVPGCCAAHNTSAKSFPFEIGGQKSVFDNFAHFCLAICNFKAGLHVLIILFVLQSPEIVISPDERAVKISSAMPSRGGFHSMHGFDIDGDDEEDRQIVTGTVGSANDNEAIYSAIRQATEGVALLDNEDQMDSSTRSHISPVDRIRHRRGAFMWLPVWCSNDVEHGSWQVTIWSQ